MAAMSALCMIPLILFIDLNAKQEVYTKLNKIVGLKNWGIFEQSRFSREGGKCMQNQVQWDWGGRLLSIFVSVWCFVYFKNLHRASSRIQQGRPEKLRKLQRAQGIKTQKQQPMA